MNNLPDFDSWIYAQAEAHMQRRIHDEENNNENDKDAIIEHEIQRILDIQAGLDHD